MMATTANSRDDFDRSFDYWSKDTGSRGGSVVSVEDDDQQSWAVGVVPPSWLFPGLSSSSYPADAASPFVVEDDDNNDEGSGHAGSAGFSEFGSSRYGTGTGLPTDGLSYDEDGDNEDEDDPGGHHGVPRLRVVVHEQLSAVYDDSSAEPTCRVEGTIYARHQGDLRGSSPSSSPLRLLLLDPLGQLVRVDSDDRFCQIAASDDVARHHPGRHRRGEHVLHVRMPQDSELDRFRLASYGCSIRPVPLLVKSRVQASQNHSRAGFKIRANPSNAVPLWDVVILLAVPPSVRGSSAKMSRPGGTWNEMKRTITWNVDRLEPGEALEVQLQFESLDGSPWDREPKFPVLVRADCRGLFSALEVRPDPSDGFTAQVSTSARVLHRKV